MECEGVSILWCAGANLGNLFFRDGNHLLQKLKLESGIFFHIVDIQTYLIAATLHTVENPDKCTVGLLFVAQMQQVWVWVIAFGFARGLCGHFRVLSMQRIGVKLLIRS